MRYFAHFLFAALLLSAAIAGFNWSVDPYAIYRDHASTGVPLRVMNERIFKTVKLAHMPADVVFIGTSRTDIGIGREQPLLRGKHLANLATFGQPIYETRRLLELALQGDRHPTVVLGLDFFAFNALFAPPSDYVEENYDPLRSTTLLMSIGSLSDSYAKYRHPLTAGDNCCHADGFRIATDLAYLQGNYRNNFIASERMYLMEKYLPFPQCAFTFSLPGRDAQSSLDDLRAMFALAQHQHVDMHLFISPAHARQWETLAAAGLWDKWEYWKKQLVSLNAKEAERAGQQPLPLWDFSGYDTVSCEDLPDDGKHVMRGYTDSSHYTPAVGQRLVARLFGDSDDWGVKLYRSNIEAHLAQIRTARHRYRAMHARDVAEIEALARETAHAKHCPGAT